MGLPIERTVVDLESGPLDLMPIVNKGYNDLATPLATLHFLVLDTLPQYADIIDGQWPAPDTSNTGPIKVAVSEQLANQILLNVGETYTLGNLEVQITGIWRVRNPNDPIWFSNPNDSYLNMVWVPIETFRARVSPALVKPIYYFSWYVIINDGSLNFQKSPQYATGLMRMTTELTRLLPGISLDYSPLDALEAYEQRANTLTTLFYAVGSPMILLALLFITLTSRIAVQQYEQEIATMRGRGTNLFQIILMNLVESLVLVVVSIPFSLLGGVLAASLMGKTVSFLKFSAQAGFPISLQGLNFLWLGVAVLLIVIARFFPMTGIFGSTIVKMKQEQSRNLKKPFWERYFLDFLLLVPAVYAYAVMRGWAKPSGLLSQMQNAGDTYRDPLLFIAPAVFSIAVCLIIQRFIPLVVRLLAAIVDRLPGAWAYLSLQQIARRAGDHTSALLLIMISLSLAIFSASTAKTLDQWLNDSVRYKDGADLVVNELSIDNPEALSLSVSMGGSTPGLTVSDANAYSDSFVTIDEHLKLPSVLAATRVGKYIGYLLLWYG